MISLNIISKGKGKCFWWIKVTVLRTPLFWDLLLGLISDSPWEFHCREYTAYHVIDPVGGRESIIPVHSLNGAQNGFLYLW